MLIHHFHRLCTMNYRKACNFTLSLLKDKKCITNSELLDQNSGDAILLKRVIEELILQDFAEDYKNVGLYLTRSGSTGVR